MTARGSIPRGGPVVSPAPAAGGGPARISAPGPAFDRREATGLQLERSKIANALADVMFVLFGFLFVVATGIGVAAAVLILFFGVV